MILNHTALYTDSLETMKDFYIRYFGAEANTKYANPKTGLETYFLSFDGGARIEIMTRPGIVGNTGSMQQAGYIHIAFSAGSREKVDELTARLAADGYAVLSGPRTTGDGYYESCVLDPDKNQIEIVV